jgi:DNA-binding transcriptional MerR regulator
VSGYTLEELEDATGVPARTIRFWRQSGLIEPPVRNGRRAFYAEEQLERVRIIGELRDRGLGLDAIAKLLEDPAGEQQTLSDVLRIGDELRRPWVEDRAADMTKLEVLETIGFEAPETVGILEHYGLITRRLTGDRYHVPSVAAVELSGDMAEAGIGADLAYRCWQLMHDHLLKLCNELIELFITAEDGPVTTDELDSLSERFELLRPIALRGIQLVFAHEMEEALREFVAGGGLLRIRRPDDDSAPQL